MNSNLKEKAIKLRRSGYSYSEILKEVPIAKSTLSLWLRSVNLAKKQKQKITQKRIAGALKGAQARKNQKIAMTKKIKDKAKKEIKNINKKDLWLIGIALYWAEGAKEHQTGTGISFSNSDDRMILLFLKWLKDIFKIKNSELIYELYIHETANIKQSQIYWSRKLSITINQLRVYLKKK